ncbi:MAG: DUF4352 domain-containing protein [Arachnia sp.]
MSVIIVLAVLGGIGSLNSNKGTTTTAANPAVSSPSSTSAPARSQDTEEKGEDQKPSDSPAPSASETETPPEPKKAGLGDTVTSGDWTFTVTKVLKPTKTIGEDYLKTEARGEFIVMQVALTNEGDSAEYLTASQIKLVSAGKTYETSSEAAIYLKGAVSLLDQVNPGLTVEGKIAFEVPEGTEPEEIQFSGGLFATDAVVTLT